MTIGGTLPRIRTRVLRNFSSLIIVRGLNLIAPVIALPYILHTVGLENYGHIAFAMVIATFAGAIIQYGFSLTGVKAIASARGDQNLLAHIFWRNFLASMMIGLAVIIVHLALILSVPSFREMWPLHLGAILLAAANALIPHWLFLGLERSYYAAVGTFIVRFSYLLLLVLFVRTPQDYALVNFLGAGMAWLNIALALAVVIGVFRLLPARVSFEQIVETIRDGFPSFLLDWTPNLYNSASIMLLGFYTAPAALGAFNAANAVVTLVISLGQLLANSFTPILSTSFGWHKVSARILVITGLVVTAVVFLITPFGATLLASSGQDMIQDNIFYLAFSIPFAFGYYAYGYNYVALIDVRKKASYVVFLISIGGIILSFFLVPSFGPAGVAIVLFLARGGMFALFYVVYRKHRFSA
ncbi:oligosaccharide flippase family protein [Rhizorhabdus histidinilytica]|uniref:oligosaccharide flippase family protein n=1 Tax=Rhizorhabdus histidinilytica TaxID=439228 RepID=UPI00321FA583